MSQLEPVVLYDTTLRDGSQSEDVAFSVSDKLRIAERLDDLGMDFIEGGWPGANPKDEAFFQEAARLSLKHSRLAAFGSTRRADNPPERDAVLDGLLRAGTGVVTIFGKTWDLHVTCALGISLEENLELVFDSVRFLKARVDTVFFDAEHFFDGFRANPDYALATLRAAREGGADCLVLCDTNGGSLTHDIALATTRVRELGAPLGIHCHNDGDMAVANTLAAVEAGANHVQATVNGIGERCGNANIISIIPNLCLKMGRATHVAGTRLRQLTSLSRFVDELANRPHQKNQPFVGLSAFAHKGGIHVSAVLKESATYEHIPPEVVGNRQRVLVSEQAGASNLFYKLQEFGVTDLDPKDPRMRDLLREIKELEHQGYQFDGAEASFEIRARRALGQLPEYFLPRGFRVIDERRIRDSSRGKDPAAPVKKVRDSEATVKIQVEGELEHLVSEGAGPVDSLFKALRKALRRHSPVLQNNTLELVDYKVRILDRGGTDARVRVLVEWRDGRGGRFGTVGVSDHIIEASYDAMLDAMVYTLFKEGVAPAAA